MEKDIFDQRDHQRFYLNRARRTRNFGHAGIGMGMNLIFARIQANIYYEPNELQFISDGLGNPTSLTSYTSVLYTAGAANLILNEIENTFQLRRNLLIRNIIDLTQRFIVPIAAATASTAVELFQIATGDTRVDDHANDIFMGWLAAAQMIVFNEFYDRRNAVIFQRQHSPPISIS